jgi:hypothetical protein
MGEVLNNQELISRNALYFKELKKGWPPFFIPISGQDLPWIPYSWVPIWERLGHSPTHMKISTLGPIRTPIHELTIKTIATFPHR